MAVLVAVFVPLEIGVQGKSLTTRTVGGILATVAGLWGLGALLEVKRR